VVNDCPGEPWRAVDLPPCLPLASMTPFSGDHRS
jgi:hypothetical protein